MKTIQSVGNPAVHTMFGKLVVPPYPASRDGGHNWCPLSHSQLIFAFLLHSHVSPGSGRRGVRHEEFTKWSVADGNIPVG